jgi:cerevisin
MSIEGPGYQAMDDAVAALTAAGIHVVVAAGNQNTYASTRSPARAPSAITVGATELSDYKADYSNYGSAVDIWAPGTVIVSASHLGDNVCLSLFFPSCYGPWLMVGCK